MAVPWLQIIPSLGLPGLNIIPQRLMFGEIVKAGLSPTSALREFRLAGGAIRTETWYRWAMEFMRPVLNVERLPRLAREEYVPDAWTTKIRYTRQEPRFRGVVEYEAYNYDLDQYFTKVIFIDSEEKRPLDYYYRMFEVEKANLERISPIEISDWKVIDFRERV